MRAAAARHPLGDIPLSVISRGLPNPLPAGLLAGLTTSLVERAWRASQDKLAGLTPDARHRIARRSGHYIMFTQPELIVEEAKRVVTAVRRERERDL